MKQELGLDRSLYCFPAFHEWFWGLCPFNPSPVPKLYCKDSFVVLMLFSSYLFLLSRLNTCPLTFRRIIEILLWFFHKICFQSCIRNCFRLSCSHPPQILYNFCTSPFEASLLLFLSPLDCKLLTYNQEDSLPPDQPAWGKANCFYQPWAPATGQSNQTGLGTCGLTHSNYMRKILKIGNEIWECSFFISFWRFDLKLSSLFVLLKSFLQLRIAPLLDCALSFYIWRAGKSIFMGEEM